MRFRLHGLAVLPVATLLVSGCAFTQMTDHAFIGGANDPPTHDNRTAVGVAIFPLAVVGDIVTAPVQGIVLLALGDDALTPRRPYRVVPSR